MRWNEGPAARVVAAIGVCALLTAGCSSGRADRSPTDPSRVEDVARRGAEVMPFDLTKTMHVFEPTSDGGRQRVVARTRDDRAQIALIRDHLREEAERFQRGDFSDPQHIHGAHMPGIAVLSKRYDEVEITRRDIAGGAEIIYRSEDDTVIAAIHDWFDAQLADHGDHAHAG